MTRHKIPHIGTTPVTALLKARRPAMVDAVLVALVAEVPVYGRLPAELVQGDVRLVVERAIEMFVDCLERDGAASEEDLAWFAESAARRAEEGVPMDMVTAAYFRGARVCSAQVAELAGPDDVGDFTRVIEALLAFLEQALSSVAAGYARHARTAQAEQASAQQLLVNALLDGSGAREAAQRAGLKLPDRYLVLALHAGRHPDEDDAQVDEHVATMRKLRRLRDELDRHYADDLLWVPSTDGGLVLVPGADRARLARAVAAATKAAGTTVHVSVVPAAPEEVPAAAGLAREVSDVVLASDRPSGVYELADVSLEYQLSRTSLAHPLLAARLEPLDGHPHLADTLSTYLASGLSRRKAAAALHVHPNTVDNRLRKIAEVTGLDPVDPADLPAITAALAARRSLGRA